MANIDIEKKGGIPWWVWLLGALLLGGLIWWAIAESNENRTAEVVPATDTTAMMDNSMTDNSAVDNSAMMDNSAMDNSAMDNSAMDSSAMMDNSTVDNTVDTGAMAAGAPISNLLDIVAAEKPMSLVGQKVDLIGAPVQAAGDGKAFWIGPSFDQKMLVVTDAATDMGGAVDGVKQAQRLNLTGEIREFTDFANAKTKYKLDDDAVTFLTNKKIYLHADKAMLDKN